MGLLDDFAQGYMSRMGGGRGSSANNEALQAKQTASAYQQLQDIMKQDYDMQKTQAQKNGQEWKMPSPTERMNDQIQAMVLSGDPNLQARGLSLMDVPKDDETTSLEKTAKALGWTPQQVFDKMHPGAASTRVNVNLPKMDQPMSVDDLQKLTWPTGTTPIPGMTMRDAGQAGARIAQTKDQAETGGATTAMTNSLGGMEANAGTTSKPIPGAVSELRNTPGIIGQAANTALNIAGLSQNPADVKFIADRNMYVGQLTKAMNGAGASDQERENWLKQAPQLTDDAQTRMIKLKALRDATQAFSQAAKNKGSTVADAPTAPKPVATKRFNPATGKIEAIN